MAKRKQSKGSSQSSKPQASTFSAHMTEIILLSVLMPTLFSLNPTLLQNVDLTPAPTKPYHAFSDFFPFYMTEHTHPTSRLLHAIGSFFAISVWLLNPGTLFAVINAALIGLIARPWLVEMQTGFVEFALVGLSFQLLSRRWSGSLKPGLMVMFVAYAFAWVGHFFFEQNKPASFIYPTYSLMGDFVMLSKMVTGEVPFSLS